MKLMVKLIVLIITSPYLMLPYTLLASWYDAYPPIVSQVVSIQTMEKPSIAGKPLYSNKLELCEDAWRDFKSYMNYKKITSKSSEQYKFISDYMLVHEADGLLKLKSDTRFIGVALGSYFGEIGSKFKFTLDSGAIIYAVKVEEKADEHSLEGCVQKWDSSIIEFVVNSNFYSYYPEAYQAGNLAVLPQFKGMITDIEVIEG